MNRSFKKRFLVNQLAAVAMAALGLGAGYLLGCVFSLQVASNWLDRYAKLWAEQDDASYGEARSVLTVLSTSPYSYCSNAEIAYYRGLVSHSQFLKDAGRIRGGKIECSAAVGRPSRSLIQVTPDSSLSDGTISYSNFPSLRDSGLKITALQLGTAYVSFASELPASPGPIPMQITAAFKSAGNALPGSAVSQSVVDKALNWSANGSSRLGDKLYATRCSTLHTNCVTASTSITEAAHKETGVVAGSTAAGGALGILLGMLLSFSLRHNRDLVQQLRRAVQRDQLQLVYQPIVVLSTREIVGAEALARWTDEDGNEVDPEIFVKLAEENGFVGTLTKSVLRHALQDFSKTLQNRPGFRISVNVAGADLDDPAFLPMLDESLKRAKVKPESVVIEISEKSTSKSEAAMETIRILRRMGHSIHIDDFGTGYSNLDKLLYLFADTIKIDKAFTGVIGTESVAVAILPQILAMAKSLNLEVVVEGVETDRQADYFPEAQPQIYGQGWLYGRPVTSERFHSLLVTDLAVPLAAPVPVSEAIAADIPDAEWTVKPGSLHIEGVRAA